MFYKVFAAAVLISGLNFIGVNSARLFNTRLGFEPPYLKETNGPEIESFLNQRIVGGIDAPEGMAPHMVSLVYKEVIIMLICGGSIVSTRHVLTAAHCIESFVWQGQIMPFLRGIIGSNKYDSTELEIEFSAYIIHPEYDYWTIDNDIGVLTTKKKIVLNDRVQIIPLDFNFISGNEDSYVTGWGRTLLYPQTNKLQYLNVKTITPQECIDGVAEASQQWGGVPPLDTKKEICTLHSIGHGMCHGDSGSALVSKRTGCQFGLVSWGFPCAVGFPDMYVRVSSYKDFLSFIYKDQPKQDTQSKAA